MNCATHKDYAIGARDMEDQQEAQRVKGLAPKPDNLTSVPRSHTVERENKLLQLSSDVCLYSMAAMCTACVCAHTQINKCNKIREAECDGTCL